MRTEEGSITVFMTFIFLILFSLLGVTLDSARFFGSRGFVAASAYGADVALFGKYNRELFQEYGLLAYGGHDGMGAEEWQKEFNELLSMNLSEKPRDQREELSLLSSEKYASVYRLGGMIVDLEDFICLAEEAEFLRQIEDWLKAKPVQEVSSRLLEAVVADAPKSQEDLTKGLEEMQEAESQDEALKEEQHTGEDTGKQESSQADSSGTSQEKGVEENPLEFVQKLVRNGILSLVCNERELVESVVERREGSAENGKSKETGEKDEEWFKESSGVDILRQFLHQDEPFLQNISLENTGKKGKVILYGTQVFDCYTSKGKSSLPYGLEYLVSGKENQKDAFAAVVNRLFLIRTMLNYTYTVTSQALQQESLATATAIASSLAAEAFIPVIQNCILLVLALEEACVDITALLDGRLVPAVKNQTNFQIQYSEICMVNKNLFQRKASFFPQASSGGAALKLNMTKGISYLQYLYVLLFSQTWTELYSRSLDLIQQDLRQRYNQTFDVSQCICQTKVQIEYGMPLLSPSFLLSGSRRAVEDRERDGLIWQNMEVAYGY